MLINQLPLWVHFLVTLVIVLLAAECGFRLGARFRGEISKGGEGALGVMVQTTLALLAFMLAFTFGVAAERFNERRLLIIEEANAIRTTYLRADLLPSAPMADMQEKLREYVDLRVQIVNAPERALEFIKRSKELQSEIWQGTVVVGKENLDSDVMSLLIESVNHTFELQYERIAAGLYARVPDYIWLVLYILTGLGIGCMGYTAGLANVRGWAVSGATIASFSLVMLMIADLDNPADGFLRSSNRPLTDLQAEMQSGMKPAP